MGGNKLEKKEIKFLLSNCRSMILKTDSIFDIFESCETDFAILTETWTNSNNQKNTEEELQKRKGLDVIMSSRENRKGGGLAVVFKKSNINFKRHSFFTGEYEILAVKCRVEVARKDLFVIATYYPPSMKAGEVERMNEIICDEVLKIKLDYKDPLIIIAGDMNKKNCKTFNDESPDIKEIVSPPTRNGERLDLCYTNCNVDKCYTVCPVWSSEGVDSDHLSLCFCMSMEGTKFTYDTVIRRKITKRGEEEFCKRIRDETWEGVHREVTACKKVSALHNIIENYKTECFPVKTSRIRNDEDPWVTNHAR